MAQAPDPAPAAPAQAPAQAPASSSGGGGSLLGGDSKFLGKDVPLMNPGSETVIWDGRAWNIQDNRVFRARFEKYLSATPQTAKNQMEYAEVINQILKKLEPRQLSPQKVREAWGLLPKAANYDIDAGLCDRIAEAVYAVWTAKRQQGNLDAANKELERNRETLEWNRNLTMNSGSISKDAQEAAIREKQRVLEAEPHVKRLVEVEAMIKANQLKKEASEVATKLEFQGLNFQLFMQRRFQHTIIANRFYRSVFDDGDNKLQVTDQMKSLLTARSGLPATLNVLDSLASEAMRDVREGVQATMNLVDNRELNSASERLSEAFMLGEYLPEIRTFPFDRKRAILAFIQDKNKLLNAVQVKDFTLAEELIKKLDGSAKDFDTSTFRAMVETARTMASMHLAKARIAASSGDKGAFETELRNAMEIWPRNPDLASVSREIFKQTDVQQQALVELDQLIAQKNYRQIAEGRGKFLALCQQYPDRGKVLQEILEKIQHIEGALIRAQEMAKHGDYAGAWESLEKTSAVAGDDKAFIQAKTEYFTRAAGFVQSLQKAEELEKSGQLGSSLAWVLEAQRLYPASELAQTLAGRLIQKLLPDASLSNGEKR
jgi:hypothetical protein